jgi:hypothetical protein
MFKKTKKTKKTLPTKTPHLPTQTHPRVCALRKSDAKTAPARAE